ncbi:MAG: hypothetical protein ABW170_19400 [Candidatus Thiodiazotropha sp. L084R]
MPYIAPYRSQLRPYNHAYAYRGLTAFATLSMAVSVRRLAEIFLFYQRFARLQGFQFHIHHSDLSDNQWSS